LTVQLLPDVEKLVIQFLLDQAEVTDICDTEIYSVLPKEKDWPALRVTRFGGVPVLQRPLYLDAATLQIDAFGGPKRQAWLLAETCRAVMADRLPGSHDEGQVTNVAFGALAYVPDVTFEPAKPRYLFTVTVTVHPLPNGS
jgi:hypothetical protein